MVPNPVIYAHKCYADSLYVTEPLSDGIEHQDVNLDIGIVRAQARRCKETRKNTYSNQQGVIACILENLQNDDVSGIRTYIELSHQKGSSSWLSVLPIESEGFSLNKTDFRDAILLRYNLPIANLPLTCVCGKSFNPDHSMMCKTGGFISARHNDIRDNLCAMPMIYTNNTLIFTAGITDIDATIMKIALADRIQLLHALVLGHYSYGCVLMCNVTQQTLNEPYTTLDKDDMTASSVR
jgi:hypothetical protein